VGVFVLMEIDKQLKLGHLLLSDRKCRICGEEKNLIDGFYRTRKDRGPVASSYSYECKVCTIKRIVEKRKKQNAFSDWNYPDW
tara:strand:+ start:27 stop:275 length:249 start_codon:yes stop_codon:yes gene_type:complete